MKNKLFRIRILQEPVYQPVYMNKRAEDKILCAYCNRIVLYSIFKILHGTRCSKARLTKKKMTRNYRNTITELEIKQTYG